MMLLLLPLSVLILRLTSVASGINLQNNTACVVAQKLPDGSYDFALETGISRPQYDFLIPAAVWFNNSVDDLGMAFQTVKTSGDIEDYIQAYWAGFLELEISRNMTEAHFENTWSGFCETKTEEGCKVLEAHLKGNLENTIKKSIQSGDIDPYWHQMELILWQLRGILDAWNNVTVTNSMTLTNRYLQQLVNNVTDIYLLQLSGDMSEIVTSLGVQSLLNANGRNYLLNQPSCSAMIKLSPDLHDVFISHNTWQGYQSMLKVIKYYDFAWHLTRKPDSPLIPADRLLFSSYPSTIGSIDDFYISSTGLVIQETTNGNENACLWPRVRQGLNNSVLEVFRVMIASRLARTSSEWISFFDRENSGTYNNQWMVFDTNQLSTTELPPKSDILWVAEQIPGFVQSADVTETLLRDSYWTSYNNPYFDYIHAASGFDDLEKKFGDVYSHDRTARALIFKRDLPGVKSLGDAFRLMRYNDFTHDPLSRCNCTPPYTAQYAISARGDLNDPNGQYPLAQQGFRLHGATDVKLVNLVLARNLSMVAVAGPTYDQVPAFQWSKIWPDKPRPRMHPDKWTFPPVLIQVNREDALAQPYLEANLLNP